VAKAGPPERAGRRVLSEDDLLQVAGGEEELPAHEEPQQMPTRRA